jgi:hypothetical protein
MEVDEFNDGSVYIQVKSKRGTGTRDEDQVTVSAVFESIDEAEEKSQKLNHIAKKRMLDARELENPPEEHRDNETTEASGNSEHPKVYLGEGSDLSGWIPVPRDVIFEEILPLVSKNRVEDDSSAIKVNFSKNIPMSGWNNVDENVVLQEIEAIVCKNKLDA